MGGGVIGMGRVRRATEQRPLVMLADNEIKHNNVLPVYSDSFCGQRCMLCGKVFTCYLWIVA